MVVSSGETMAVIEEDYAPRKCSRSSWRSALAALKRQLKILSPVRCLAGARDSYVRGMNTFAANSGTMMVQGPHIAGLSRNASRSVDSDDDLYHLIRAASARKGAGFGDFASGPLPRSASVQEFGSAAPRVRTIRQHSQQQQHCPRSASHSAIARFPRTVLESTQEE